MPVNASLVPKYETEKPNGEEKNDFLREMREHFAALGQALRARDADLKEIHRKLEVLETVQDAIRLEAKERDEFLRTSLQSYLNQRFAGLESMLAEQKRLCPICEARKLITEADARVKAMTGKTDFKPKAKQRRAKR